MSARRSVTGWVVRAGTDVVQRRIASMAGIAAAVIGGGFALIGCGIAAILGNGPGFGWFLAIVAGTALVAFIAVRTIVTRIDIAALGALVARRAAARAAGRRRR